MDVFIKHIKKVFFYGFVSSLIFLKKEGYAQEKTNGVKENPILNLAFSKNQNDPEVPVFLEADEVTFDEVLATTTARGNVRIIRTTKDGMVVLEADTITVNEKNHLVTASGNVVIFEPTGDVYKANYIELTDDLKKGFIKTVRLLTKDNRRISAISANRVEEGLTTFEKVVYSPCNLCKENPEDPPLWQIKAIKVVRDESKGDVNYHDVWMEFAGTPVFYTPYLSHADPIIKKRSGILTPYFGGSSGLGAFTGVPYHYVINDSQDMTLTPLVMTKQTPVLIAEYRQRFSNGAWETLGSITESKRIAESAGKSVQKSKEVRGHIQSQWIFNLDETWRTGGMINRASDPTYIRKYSFNDVESPQTSSLDSTLYTEGFYDRSYADIRGYAFQPTRVEQSQSITPYILPLASYSYVSPQRQRGDHFFSNNSLLLLNRSVGTNVRRLSVEGGWEMPFMGEIGELYTFTTSLRGDAYDIDRYKTQPSTQYFKGEKGRLFPQFALDCRYPLFNNNEIMPTLIAPEIQFVAAPNGLNNTNIPNEDSLDFEFDETNIFRRDRFPGLDVLDTGQRFNYGSTIEIYPEKIKSVSFFLGQSYEFSKNKFIPEGLGIHKGFSDIIGNFIVNPSGDTKLRYRVLWDKNTLRALRNQVGADIGPAIFRVSANYLFVAKNNLDTSFNGKEQISGSISSQFTTDWKAVFQASRNLGRRSSNLAQSYGVIYEDECFIFKTSFIRTFYQDRDIRPDNMILFSLSFKTIGDVDFKGLKIGAKNRQEKAQKLLGN
ncbi:MAG: LPS-assembly protein LptD [Proteobacteria bacterium]|nr:LPS-assembly protein LptD [Pseudomonadota bacterium]